MRILNDLLAHGQHDFDLWDRSVILGYRGSMVHGTYSGGKDSIDDKDVMGIIIPPIDYYFGLKVFASKGTKELKRQYWDVVIYDLRKMTSLLLKNRRYLYYLWPLLPCRI